MISFLLLFLKNIYFVFFFIEFVKEYKEDLVKEYACKNAYKLEEYNSKFHQSCKQISNSEKKLGFSDFTPFPNHDHKFFNKIFLRFRPQS